MLINFFDRVNLSVAHDALRDTFHMDEVAFGYLAGAYNWTYAICQLPVGALLDAVGVALVGRIGSLLWGIATLAAAVSPTYGTLFASRMLLGIGESPIFPANAKAIGLWFPPEERGLPTAIFDAAAKFSTAIGVPLIGILLLHAGWRMAFAATALTSLLFFAAFYFIYRDPPPGQRFGDTAEARHPPVPFTYLLRQRKVYGIFIGYGAYNYVFYLLLTWLPTYLAVTLHINLLHSFLYTGVPWLIATATDLIAGGWLVDALMRRGFSSTVVRQAILIAGMLLGMGLLGAVHSSTPRIGALLDQHLHRRTRSFRAGQLVSARAHRTARRGWPRRRCDEPLQPDLRHRSAGHHRLSLRPHSLLRHRLQRARPLSARRDRRLYLSARAHRADPSARCALILGVLPVLSSCAKVHAFVQLWVGHVFTHDVSTPRPHPRRRAAGV